MFFEIHRCSYQSQNELLKWAPRIAEHYMGKNRAEEYVRFNSGEGAIIVRMNSTKIVAEKDIAVIS